MLFAKFEFCRINKSCTKLPRSLTFSDNNNYAETSQAAASSAWNTTWGIWRRYSGSWSVSLKGTRSSLVFTILQKPFRLFIINIFFNKKNFPSWNLENILDNFFFSSVRVCCNNGLYILNHSLRQTFFGEDCVTSQK